MKLKNRIRRVTDILEKLGVDGAIPGIHKKPHTKAMDIKSLLIPTWYDCIISMAKCSNL